MGRSSCLQHDTGEEHVKRKTQIMFGLGLTLALVACGTSTKPDTKPTITLDATPTSLPKGGGKVTLTATVKDDKGIKKVEFYNGGATPFATDTTAPYSVDSTITTDTTFTAKVYDTADQVTTSAPVSVTVSTALWEDNFDGAALDTTKWGYQLGNGFGSGAGYVAGWGNNELEYYTDRAENVSLKDGNLVITAIKENYKGDANGTMQDFTWTSGRIRTAGKFSRTYGKFEIRAKLPAGKGLWPAIWMLPEDQPGNPYGTWAANGEIDIMEAWGSKPGKVAHTLHYGGMWPNNVYSGEEFEFPNAGRIDEWHTYTLEWRSNEIKWFVDGKLAATRTQWWSSKANPPKSDADLNAWPAPFDKPFYLLLNLAVGGNFDGNPDANTPTKAEMLVDYVKVWSLPDENRNPGPRPDMTYPWTPKPARPPLEDGNLIYNPSFDWAANDPRIDASTTTLAGADQSHFWTSYNTDDAAMTFSNDAANSKALKVDITKAGTVNYAVQVRQDGINIQNLKKYEVSFDIWASAARNIMVKVGGGPDRGYAAYSGEQTVAVGTTKERKTLKFDMLATSDAAARLEFNLGNAGNNTVWIDNVSVKAVGDIAIRQPKADGNLIYNGDFSATDPAAPGIGGVAGSDYWSFWENGNNGVVNSIVDGKFKMAVAHVDPANDWHIQFMQENVPVFSGKSYTLTFTGSASKNISVPVIVGEKGGSYQRYLNVKADLTTTPQTFSYTFTAPVTNYAAMLQILGAVGQAGDSYDLIFDDFKLVQNP